MRHHFGHYCISGPTVLLPLAAFTMDPIPVNPINKNATPPIEVPTASLGCAHPSGSQHSSHTSSSQRWHPTTSIGLRISPAAGSANFGYIYIADNKPHQTEDAITTHFNSEGWEVTCLPCPNFNAFMAAYSLLDCDVSFVTDLAQYIISTGACIL